MGLMTWLCCMSRVLGKGVRWVVNEGMAAESVGYPNRPMENHALGMG